jgi:uncharacterized membrane protein
MDVNSTCVVFVLSIIFLLYQTKTGTHILLVKVLVVVFTLFSSNIIAIVTVCFVLEMITIKRKVCSNCS